MDFSIHSNPRPTAYPEPPTQVKGPDTGISKTNQDSGSNRFVYEVFYQEEKNYLVQRVILLFSILSLCACFLLNGAKHSIHTTTLLKLFSIIICP